ncbi:phosphoglycolate phosphatase [Nitrincola tapanii]|uniref:Phosphoglycolate phosphatase n=1 Tax=Nitrincola tapanii TaxID=1708751 RepID=A0A5A9W1F0_9GAMM|nr:phosphoglycolate phosphatase [Nitrincola tapanii]KAA0874039.1 phosphoglycolate phosphatase [Nitrincola tapanii]
MRENFAQGRPAALIYDLDGTLVDSVPDLARAVDQMLLALGADMAGEAAVRTWVGLGAQRLVEQALAASAAFDSQSAEEIFPVAYELFLSAYSQCNGRLSQIYPGVRAFLEHWHAEGIPQVVVTNKPAAFTEPLLAQMQLQHFFVQVVAGDHLARKKPYPDQLNWVFEQLQLLAQEVLMLGDSRNDIQAARAAGCPVICVDYGYNHGVPIAQDQPDRVVKSLLDLL